MTVVLVHGNPESDAIWGLLIDALGRADVVTLSPPGFGAPLPSDFDSSYLAYRDWLEAELSALDGPVDLVGHDWGGITVVNAMMNRPELVRSWTTDALGIFDAEYVWHDMAQVWQTAGAGEEFVATMMSGTVEERADRLAALGLGHDIAAELAVAQNAEMAKAILRLYRSAAQPAMANAGRSLEAAAARPGLAILATGDEFMGTPELRRRAADRAGARTVVLEGLGHWWMLEDPARAAAALTEFWAVTSAAAR